MKTVSFHAGATTVAIVAIMVTWFYSAQTRHSNSSEETEEFKYFEIDNFFSESERIKLMNLFESIDTFEIARPSSTTKHFGEATDPVGYDNKSNQFICNKSTPYLRYNNVTKKCMFISRIDSGIHYVLTGGYQHLREPIEYLAKRPTFFNTIININNKEKEKREKDNEEQQISTLKSIFDNPQLIDKSKEVCGKNYSYLQPYQSILSLQLPGHMIATHSDASYFAQFSHNDDEDDDDGDNSNSINVVSVVSSATPDNFPIWLLTVMKHSKLFDKYKIKEVNTIGYIHPWGIENNDDINSNNVNYNNFGGELVVFTKRTNYKWHGDVKISADGGKATIVDGTECPHATQIFLPKNSNCNCDQHDCDCNNNCNNISRIIDMIDPFDAKNLPLKIKFDKLNQLWKVYKQSNVSTNLNFSWNHVRASIASRLWCFKNEQHALAFDQLRSKSLQKQLEIKQNKNGALTMENVLSVLKQDLIQNKGYKENKINEMDRYTLGLTLLNAYIEYPKKSDNDSVLLIPFNYCVVFKRLPDWRIVSWIMCTICHCS